MVAYAYSLYLGKYWGGERFNADRSHAVAFKGRLPNNCIIVRSKG